MELANQAMYFGFGLIFFGLSFSSFHSLKHQFNLQSSRHYWAFSLLTMSLSCLFFLLYPITGGMILTLANLMQVATDISLAFLFRSFNTKITKPLLTIFLVSLPVTAGVIEFIRANETYDIRVDFLSIIAIALSIWQIYELVPQYMKSKSIYLGFLILAIGAQIVMWVYRIWMVDHYLSFFEHHSVFDEHVPEFIARLIVIVLYALIFIAVGNYFYNKLVMLERQRRQEKEEQMLVALKSLASARDSDTGNHIVRTQHYVKVLAERLQSMGHYSDVLDVEKINAMFKAAPLHDIGKVGIPDHILLKPGPLSEEEWDIMKTHASIGKSVLHASASHMNTKDQVIESAINIAGCHHERWDGSGYPEGLKGEAIPLEARIMSLADMYDALVTKRPYKQGWTHEDAVNEIVSKKGAYFDPVIVDAFMAEKDNFSQISRLYKD